MQFENQNTATGSCSVAQTGSIFALNAFEMNCSHAWIIDSGASDHMTSFSNLFSTYTTCSGQQKIMVADGSFSPIAGKGTVQIFSSLVLKSVLLVRNLTYNLLSLGKLTKDLQCLVIFTSAFFRAMY